MRRAGTTLAELLTVLVVLATVLALALPPLAAGADRAAVRAATRDAETVLSAARVQAMARRTVVWVVLDSAAAELRWRAGNGTHRRALGSIYGVTLRATRDSTGYDGRGLGYGAANLTLVLARGRACDTLFVSRLGRVRR